VARIRTIKPEFPQSEDIGRLSRDARLLFVQLWTIVDDDGRARAASRMLASLLYPYDDDAPSLIEGWLNELEHAGLIRRYEFAGAKYLDVINWLKHQKIDRPSKSKLPSFEDAFASPREFSRALDADLGPRTLDLGGERIQPSADDARAPSDDPRTRLFRDGLATIARLTGRGPDSCRSIVGKWLKLANDEAVEVLAAIDDADRNRVANPTAWITKRLTANGPQTGPPAGYSGLPPRPGSKEAIRERHANALTRLAEFASSPHDETPGRDDRPPPPSVLPFPASGRP
jgi:hypothetical protein